MDPLARTIPFHQERERTADISHQEQLREWARGSYSLEAGSWKLEAGTELLLRAFGGRFAAQGKPWIRTSSIAEGETTEAWIDFAAIP